MFDEMVSPMMDRLFTSRRDSRELARIRDLLLPKLMSGETSLRDAEALAETVA